MYFIYEGFVWPLSLKKLIIVALFVLIHFSTFYGLVKVTDGF